MQIISRYNGKYLTFLIGFLIFEYTIIRFIDYNCKLEHENDKERFEVQKKVLQVLYEKEIFKINKTMQTKCAMCQKMRRVLDQDISRFDSNKNDGLIQCESENVGIYIIIR